MSFTKFIQATLLLFVGLATIAIHPAHAKTEAVLYSFCSLPNCADGQLPVSRLTLDTKGNLFGTTLTGGAFGYGTVFEVSPNGSGGWDETVLYSFSGAADGGNPSPKVIFDSAGNLYGTAGYGGNHTCGDPAVDCGVVFELSPVGSGWKETVIYSFTGGADGGEPSIGMVIDATGNLYGQTYLSGTLGSENIFELGPSGTAWTFQVIYNASLFTVGGVLGLTLDAAGNIFLNGAYQIIELSPNGQGGWNPTMVSSALNDATSNNGSDDPLTIDQAGNLYGTGTRGGPNHFGSVVEISRTKNGRWVKKILYSFSDGVDAFPYANVVLDAAGNIYGATVGADIGTRSRTKYQLGTVYKLVAPKVKGGSYTEKVLWNFTVNNPARGIYPVAGVIQDSAGNLYGTTYAGGLGIYGGVGTVFKVTP
jgi:uncharacterized repeat protein (TIGR03803 family)